MAETKTINPVTRNATMSLSLDSVGTLDFSGQVSVTLSTPPTQEAMPLTIQGNVTLTGLLGQMVIAAFQEAKEPCNEPAAPPHLTQLCKCPCDPCKFCELQPCPKCSKPCEKCDCDPTFPFDLNI
jgi:hypothetical protein